MFQIPNFCSSTVSFYTSLYSILMPTKFLTSDMQVSISLFYFYFYWLEM